MANEISLSISSYHRGQIVYPVVTVERRGQNRVVRWHWVDQSIPGDQPGHEYGHGEAKGNYAAVCAALKAEGIRVDDHRL